MIAKPAPDAAISAFTRSMITSRALAGAAWSDRDRDHEHEHREQREDRVVRHHRADIGHAVLDELLAQLAKEGLERRHAVKRCSAHAARDQKKP